MTTAADLKQQLAELSDRRSILENNVNVARARLEATGLGMDEPLVDSEVQIRTQMCRMTHLWYSRVLPLWCDHITATSSRSFEIFWYLLIISLFAHNIYCRVSLNRMSILLPFEAIARKSEVSNCNQSTPYLDLSLYHRPDSKNLFLLTLIFLYSAF